MPPTLATRRTARPRAALRRVSVEFDVPEELLHVFHGEKRLAERIREGVVMELLRHELISTGKAREMLGLDFDAFLALQNAHDIPTFRFDAEDFAASLDVARTLHSKSHAA